ncbi:MAG: hypothetical protein ACXWFY_08070 [Chthoniobacterales bacterium]
MKKSKRSSKTTTFAPGEHIRVVPLYHPKPSIPVGGLKRGEGAGDLFDGKPHVLPISAKLTYRGGALLQKVKVFTIFWGKLWGTNAASTKLIADLNKFFTTILTSAAIDQLAEYSVGKKKIGRGSFIGTKTIKTNAPSGSITDSAIQKQLKKWIAAKTVPAATSNTLYFIYLDPGVVSIMGGSKSCSSYCGYHEHVGKVYYAIMPYPTCNGCLGGKQAFDALTGTSMHELCEAITDPVPGDGWYDDKNGEIGDICAWNFKTVAGYNVQLEWSNAQNKCV